MSTLNSNLVVIFLFVTTIATCNSSKLRSIENGDDVSYSQERSKKISIEESPVPNKNNSRKSEFDSVLQKLSELKDFAIKSFVGSRKKNASQSGRTFWDSSLSSFITSAGSIRALEHLQTLKSKLLQHFRKFSKKKHYYH